MVTFLNFNFLLFFILFFPLSYLVSSKYIFFFRFSSLFFSSTHTYSSYLLHTHILSYLHSIFTCIFVFLVQLCLSFSLLYLHHYPHNSHIGKHCKQNTPENFINCVKLPTDRKTQANCHKHKHKPIAQNRSENTNTNPHQR